MWEYLRGAKRDIITWTGGPDEAAEQIAHEVMRILHPHFTFAEITDELKGVFNTFHLTPTKQLEEKITGQMVDYASRLMKGFEK